MPIVTPPAAVEFQSVSKIYRTGFMGRGRICALRNVTLSVPRGSRVRRGRSESGRQDHARQSPFVALPADFRSHPAAGTARAASQHAVARRLSPRKPSVSSVSDRHHAAAVLRPVCRSWRLAN